MPNGPSPTEDMEKALEPFTADTGIKRFGLVYVDFSTQRRVRKRSGLWYRDFIASAR